MKVEGKSKRGNPAGHMRYEVDYDELEGGGVRDVIELPPSGI